MHRFPETVIAVICAADQGDTVRQSRRDYESVDDFQVYEAHVDSGGTLYWFGNAFEPPIEFRLHGMELQIDGISVPLAPGGVGSNTELLESLRREPTPEERLAREAGACRSYMKWLQQYRNSPLVDSVFVRDDTMSIEVLWAGDHPRDREAVLRLPGDRPTAPPPWELTWDGIRSAASQLRTGKNVWCFGAMSITPFEGSLKEFIETLPPPMAELADAPLPLGDERREE
jgi:hypothetical protein